MSRLFDVLGKYKGGNLHRLRTGLCPKFDEGTRCTDSPSDLQSYITSRCLVFFAGCIVFSGCLFLLVCQGLLLFETEEVAFVSLLVQVGYPARVGRVRTRMVLFLCFLCRIDIYMLR